MNNQRSTLYKLVQCLPSTLFHIICSDIYPLTIKPNQPQRNSTMKYFIILLAAVATASAVAVPEAQPESLDKRACYTAVSKFKNVVLLQKTRTDLSSSIVWSLPSCLPKCCLCQRWYQHGTRVLLLKIELNSYLRS